MTVEDPACKSEAIETSQHMICIERSESGGPLEPDGQQTAGAGN